MKLLISLCLCFLFVSYASAQKLSVKYDKFKDQTMVSGENDVRLKSSQTLTRILTFNLFAFYPGETPTKNPEYFIASFTSESDTWRYLTSNSLILLVDGKRLDLGKASHDGKIKTGRYSSGVTERMYYKIPFADAEEIAKGKAVEMQLGAFEGELTADALDLIRAVLKSAVK